jgi:hypothetical protein
MLAEVAQEVCSRVVGHQCSRIVTVVQRPWIGRAALLALVPSMTHASVEAGGS